MASVIDCLRVLGLNEDADLQDIKRAHHSLVIELHPDKTGNDGEKAELFKQVRAAYERLMQEIGGASSSSDTSPPVARSKSDTYKVLGDTSNWFLKERTEWYDLEDVTRCCNYSLGVPKEINDMMRALRAKLVDKLNGNRKTMEHFDGRQLVGVVVASKKARFGRYTTAHKGHKGRMIVGWDGDKPRFSREPGAVYPYNLSPMTKVYRHHIQRRLYHDVDVVNCHPSVALQLFEQNGLVSPMLGSYVTQRDVWLRRLQEVTKQSKEAVKDLVLAVMNGGCETHWASEYYYTGPMPKEITELRQEVTRNRDALLKMEPYSEVLNWVSNGGVKESPERSAFAILLQDCERRIMECVVIAAQKEGWKVPAHVHDGLMLLKRLGIKLDDAKLGAWCEYVHAKTGFHIRLAVKLPPAEDALASVDGTELLPQSELYPGEECGSTDAAPKTPDAPEAENAQNHREAAKIVISRLNGRVKRCNRALYARNGLAEWLQDKEAQFCLEHIVLTANIRGPKLNTGNVPDAKNVARAVCLQLDRSDEFPAAFFTSTYRKLCFKDGVYCFNASRKLEWSEAQDVHTIAIIKRNFPQRNEALMREVRTRLLESSMGPEQVEELLYRLARALAGEVYDKIWVLIIGQRNSGKSTVFEEALKTLLGDVYMCVIDATSLFVNREGAGGEAARRNHFLAPAQHARIARTNEVKTKNAKLDGTAINSFTGGDEHVSRQINCEEQSYRLQATLFMLCNDLPPIEPPSAAENMIVLRTPYKYVDAEYKRRVDPENKDPMLRVADKELKTWAKRQDVADALLHLVLDAYMPEKREPCHFVQEQTNKMRAAMGDEFMMLRSVLSPGGPDDFALIKDIRHELRVVRRFKGKKKTYETLLEQMGGVKEVHQNAWGWRNIVLHRMDPGSVPDCDSDDDF